MKPNWVGVRGGLGQGEAVCGTAQMSHLPHSVGGITGAVLVTDEAIETWGTESLLAIRPFKPSFAQTGSIDMMTLGSVLTLTPLVTLRAEAAHRTVILTPGGHITLSLKLVLKKYQGPQDKLEPRTLTWNKNVKKVKSALQNVSTHLIT